MSVTDSQPVVKVLGVKRGKSDDENKNFGYRSGRPSNKGIISITRNPEQIQPTCYLAACGFWRSCFSPPPFPRHPVPLIQARLPVRPVMLKSNNAGPAHGTA